MVEQTKKRKIELVNQYMKGKLQMVNLKLHREADAENVFDDVYKATLDTSAKQDEGDIIKMLRWLAKDLGFTVPPAFTDNEVDAINSEIRTKVEDVS